MGGTKEKEKVCVFGGWGGGGVGVLKQLTSN